MGLLNFEFCKCFESFKGFMLFNFFFVDLVVFFDRWRFFDDLIELFGLFLKGLMLVGFNCYDSFVFWWGIGMGDEWI